MRARRAGLAHCDEPCARAAAFTEHDIIGANRSTCCHHFKRDTMILEPLAQSIGQDPHACPDTEKK